MTKNFYTSVERYGNNILWRGYKNGEAFSKKVKFQPKFYLPTQDESPFRTLIGSKPIAPKILDSMAEAKEFLARYEGVGGFDIHGNSNYVAQFIQEKYPDDIEFDMSLINIFSFDIEVDISDGYPDMELADKSITSIATKSSKEDHYNLLGLKGYDKTQTVTGIDPDLINFKMFDTEKELLLHFMSIWKKNYPDIITGWNVEYFDIMYIVTRIIRLFSEEKAKELSPWGSIKKRTAKTNFGKEQSTYEIMGMSVLDYMDAFKKFGYKYGTQESYKLDHVAYTVLGEKKLSYEEYGSLTALYEQNPQLYLDYNLKDTHLIQRFEDKTALLSLVLTVAYGGGVNFKEAFGTVGIWDTTIYRRLMKSNIVPMVKGAAGGAGAALVGGYVKEPKVGMYKWVVSFDLNSLYPHLMMQYNMSPETYIKDQKEYVTQDMILSGEYKNENKDVSVAANGAMFSNKQIGVIPSIINEYYDKRAAVKRKMLGVESEIEAIKEELEKRKAA